jgi:hypothetical protein
MKVKDKVWNILTTDEQTAITLSLSHGKSSWEVGEIMGKSHYKYLEINSRAKRFFKLFTEYFTEYEELFPEGVRVQPNFQEYIEKSIIQRLGLKITLNTMADPDYVQYKKRKREIIEQMNLIKSNPLSKDLYDLILEFDRWNNHRILPDELQEPSAFKRRNKTREKNRLKLVSNLPQLTIDTVIKKYEYNGKLDMVVWLPLMDQSTIRGYHLIKVLKKVENISGLTYLGLYVFKDKSTARDYIDLVYNFIRNDETSCRKGLSFWPQFRVLSSKAINYNKLENIKVNRKYFEKMVGDNDFLKVRKRNKKEKLVKPEPNAPIDVLWGKIG